MKTGMAKVTLIVESPHGRFSRETDIPFTYAVIRNCPRAMAAFKSGTHEGNGSVYARWYSDQGFALTWHYTEHNAREAASTPYIWGDSEVLGIYPVIIK